MAIVRSTGLGYPAALRLTHKVKRLMASGFDHNRPLMGHVEIDETLLGGKERFKHRDKRIPNSQGMSLKGKQPVFAMVQRGGEVRAFHMHDLKRDGVVSLIKDNVRANTEISTDESRIYRGLKKHYPHHGRVHHAIRQFKKKNFCTNTVEGFFSCFKRTMRTYNRVCMQHLQKYVDEVCFTYNHRGPGNNLFLALLELVCYYRPPTKYEQGLKPIVGWVCH